ncbi:MAG: DNA primase small subunit domain-containing protein [Candidatus Thorarchaeota archaeon]
MAQDRSVRNRKLLQLVFQEYYRTNQDKVDIPDRVQNREFGLENWDYGWVCRKRTEELEDGRKVKRGCGSGGRSFTDLQTCPNCNSPGLQTTRWSRHVGFRTKDDLLNELVKSVPHSVYHSAAFYQVPVARTMSEKEWSGAELVFDIDADHLDSECASRHDSWQCTNSNCGKTGTGARPDTCPDCSENSFWSLKWVCDECLNDARINTIKLYDKFLVDHFGLDSDKIQLNYSGHRGYHVRVKDPSVFSLDSDGRMELAHYISGIGLISTIASDGYLRIVPSNEKERESRGRLERDGFEESLSDGRIRNWQLPSIARKLADAMIEFIDSIESYEGKESWVKALISHRQDAIAGLKKNPPLLSAKVKGVGAKYWQEIANKAALSYSAHIDIPVTTDVHRVIRLIGSLNGKTGFSVTGISRDELTEFDPFEESIVFGDEPFKVKIPKRTIDIPKFRIRDTVYGPFNDTTEELPKAVAVFLLCKGIASIE